MEFSTQRPTTKKKQSEAIISRSSFFYFDRSFRQNNLVFASLSFCIVFATPQAFCFRIAERWHNPPRLKEELNLSYLPPQVVWLPTDNYITHQGCITMTELIMLRVTSTVLFCGFNWRPFAVFIVLRCIPPNRLFFFWRHIHNKFFSVESTFVYYFCSVSV